MSKQDKTTNDSPSDSIKESLTGDSPKMGAPTKYTPELIEKSKKYLFVYKDLDEVCPTVEGLAMYIDISTETVYRWIKEDDKKDFYDTVKKVSRAQKMALINNGLNGKFNAKITQLLLGANHSVIEKSSQEISGPDGKPQEHSWTIEFVDAKDNDK